MKKQATYKIVRFFQNDEPMNVIRGLTLSEAKRWCKDPETSSTTCTTKSGKLRTEIAGPWFDGFVKE